MWWKYGSAALLIYVIIAGLSVPLKPGITYVNPSSGRTGQTLTLTLHGYNSFYTRSNASDIRVWLQYDADQALAGKSVKVLSDTTLEATFVLPARLPENTASALLSAIVDHPADGVSLLPDAVEIRQDTTAADNGSSWTAQPVGQLNIKKDFSFPYRNVIYESIRNTYFHVPMWMALMVMFIASVWNSLMYLRHPQLDYDRKAAAYAEMGLLFGALGLVTGMLWAHYAWGKAWSNDIKQLMTAVALLIYLAYFILRSSFDEPEKGARLAAVYNIFAFASLVPLLYIIPRMFASLHPGATGNPAFGSQDLDNTMRMVFYPAVIGFTGIGFWIAELRYRIGKVEGKMNDE
ncbi:MAG: cytochrome c biogenesis protein CcsA [Saprospiraceae bacterium]|nr:cytochrome c biogenesis protein CcsA [Saprospiraceae bacterium]